MIIFESSSHSYLTQTNQMYYEVKQIRNDQISMMKNLELRWLIMIIDWSAGMRSSWIMPILQRQTITICENAWGKKSHHLKLFEGGGAICSNLNEACPMPYNLPPSAEQLVPLGIGRLPLQSPQAAPPNSPHIILGWLCPQVILPFAHLFLLYLRCNKITFYQA